MAKYVPVYRCGICDELFSEGEAKEVAPERLPYFVDIKSKFQKIDNPFSRISEYSIHSCENGAVALAAYVGLVPEDSIK